MPQASRTTTNARRDIPGDSGSPRRLSQPSGPASGRPPLTRGGLSTERTGPLDLGAWMSVEVDVAQTVGREVGVDLGRPDVGVPEHLLERAQIAAADQQ